MIHLLVHDAEDSMGVALVEGMKAEQELTAWVMAQDRTITTPAVNDIPIGHKLALMDFPAGGTVIKCGHDIGRVTAAVKVGEHDCFIHPGSRGTQRRSAKEVMKRRTGW